MKLKFNKFKKENMKNLIGIDKNKAKKLTEILNKLLADYEIFYQNLRGFHWNIKGREFFELHVKFEELYNEAFIKIDEIAERILTLEGIPMHTYTAVSYTHLDVYKRQTLMFVKKVKTKDK